MVKCNYVTVLEQEVCFFYDKYNKKYNTKTYFLLFEPNFDCFNKSYIESTKLLFSEPKFSGDNKKLLLTR